MAEEAAQSLGGAGSGAPEYYASSRSELVAFLAEHRPFAGRALDVGCAAGGFGAQLLARGYDEVVGIEPFAAAADLARTQLTSVVCAPFQGIDQDALGTFDLVSFADSLEHMPDPWQALRDARALLADEGALLLSVPNVAHWTVLWRALELGRWDYEDAGLLDRTHIRFFTPATIGEAVADAGFRVVATGGVGEETIPLPAKRRWLRPLIIRRWPHILVYQHFVLAVPTVREEFA